MIPPIDAVPAGGPPSPGAKPASAAEAARQFESLLLAQVLRSAHEAGAGLGEDEQDSEAETMYDVAAQQFAVVMANQGGIGIAQMLAAQLQKK
jgi:Rod binding domain-containing protein